MPPTRKTAAAIAAVIVAILGPAAAQPTAVGVREIRLHDAARDRPVWLQVWYPAAAGSEETAQRYGVGTGNAARDADLAEGRHPVVLLSHGALGSARDYGWLGEGLARSGWLVVGVSHYGESWIYGPDTVDPANVLALWKRPLDLRFVLDTAPGLAFFSGGADFGNVVAMGHSSGGNTAIAMGGGRLDPQALGAYCAADHDKADRGCDYARAGTNRPAEPAEPAKPADAATKSYRDERIAAVVALDPAVGPGYDRASLAEVTVPVVVFGSVDNDFLPFAAHAGRYAERLPNAELHALDDGEGHFVYLDECEAPLEANGVPLCRDRPGVDRGAVHERILTELSDLAELLPDRREAASP